MAKKKLDGATPNQRKAWEFYGDPTAGKTVASAGTTPIGRQVGEVRYIIGWMADQMVRMGWRVSLNGSETWSITPERGGETIRSDSKQSDIEKPDHPANASRALLETIDWNARTVREVTTNLFVAGEMHYSLDNDGKWRVVSVIRGDRDEIVNRASISVHALWPHPGDPSKPDAPIFGVLGTLDDMAWLNRLSRSQSANRVGMRGIIGVADGFATASGATGEEFWDSFEASLSRPMDSPEDVSPVGIVGSTELVEPKDGGMKGLSWIIPDFPYDERIDERMEKLVQRLAYGLPVPPEILLGMQAQSKATAFQVEGATYRAHIEPVAMLVSDIANRALSLFLPDELGTLEISPDSTSILARRHSIQDVLEAFDRGAVSFEYLREVLGIPTRAAAGSEDIALRRAIATRGGTPAAGEQARDPANVAAEEPLSAAAALADETTTADTTEPSPESDDDAWLAESLLKVSQQTLYELIGAFPQAVERARERLGARIRADSKYKAQVSSEYTNAEIPLRLGSAGFQTLGIDDSRIIDAALASTLKWWEGRVEQARESVQAILSTGEVEATFSLPVSESVDLLRDLLHSTIYEDGAVPDSRFRDIVDVAGQ